MYLRQEQLYAVKYRAELRPMKIVYVMLYTIISTLILFNLSELERKGEMIADMLWR